ncbi:hypothetical protein QYF36_019149 [Acer negundo]|nr:hypothetical protein QYF36_019149 [Acer negundo]
MQLLKDQLTNTINHLHTIFETRVFFAICRGYWDRMGQDVLSFLENKKENRSRYKGSRIAVSVSTSINSAVVDVHTKPIQLNQNSSANGMDMSM